MTTRTSRAAALTGLLLAGAATGLAGAQATAPFQVTVSPAKAGAGSKVAVTLGGPDVAAAQQGKAVRSIRITAPAGFRVDTRGVKATCTRAQAQDLACPAASKVGSGSGTLNSSAVGDIPATAQLFLIPALQAGDVAGVQIVASALGQKVPLNARVVPDPAGLYLLVSDIDKALPLPVTIKSLSLAFGATNVVRTTTTKRVKTRVKVHGKTVTKTVTKKVTTTKTISALNNPPACTPSGWTVSAALGFTDGSSLPASTVVACTP